MISDNDDEDEDEAVRYRRALFRDDVLVIERIDNRCWVIEDIGRQRGRFVHLFRVYDPAGGPPDTACDCSDWRLRETCRHTDVYSFARDDFEDMYEVCGNQDGTSAVVEITNGGGMLSVLTVPKGIGRNVNDGKRTIVRWDDFGQWDCRECGRGQWRPFDACIHRQRAAHYLRGLLGDEEFDQLDDQAVALGDNDDEDELIAEEDDEDKERREPTPVSHLPIPPPRFCATPAEIAQGVSPYFDVHAHANAIVFTSGIDDRCRACHRQPLIDEGIVERRQARLFADEGIFTVEVEVRKCRCRRRGRTCNIGPNLSRQGVFNWNNEILFTHDLFNTYTIAMLNSTTPFAAFYTGLMQKYTNRQFLPNPQRKMVSQKLFNAALFAYMSLQKMHASFECPTCGPEPKTVIADGVSISHARQANMRLRPPTYTHDDSPVYGRTVPAGPVAFLFKEQDRDTVRAAVDLADDNKWDRADRQITKLERSSCSRAQAVGTVLASLRDNDRLRPNTWPLYRRLLRQISTNNTVLLVCHPSAIYPLTAFVRDWNDPDCDWNYLDSVRRSFPAVGDLLERHLPDPPATLLHLISRLVSMSNVVLTCLTEKHPLAPVDDTIALDDDWKTSGCYYGLPQIRHRPMYPLLKEPQPGDLRRGACNDREEQADPDACQKYYSTYTKRAQTGGIMVLWCRHAVCLGFHCMPTSEGRNDVFLAVYTRWTTAPETIVYDFACSLGAYSLLREPEFFANTLFVIDQFHEDRHRTCSESLYLGGFMANNPGLASLNSSAAESGNSGLGRIRKSVSYCKPLHAVIYTHHFLSVYNRVKREKILERMRR